MTPNAEAVDIRTGELVPVVAVPFALTEYLSGLSGKKALSEQNALAAAYDAACAELIGPNDVQRDGGRTFKKKSAWRKLARYFNISVEVARVEREVMADGHFLATVTARAVAPWGQRYEEIGACCSDEATGKRVITVADAIATASTRAQNRAISNLIAMGEVSAEEMDKGSPAARGSTTRTTARVVTAPEDFVMPFGKESKGRRLGDMTTEALQSAADWAASKDKFEEFQRAANAVLANRDETAREMDGGMSRVLAEESGGIGALDDGNDGLPF